MRGDGCRSGSTVDRMTGRDGLRALGIRKAQREEERESKQHLDILCFNLFSFSRRLSRLMYPPTFWHASSVISLAL